MRARALISALIVAMLCVGVRAEGTEAEADLKGRVERIIAELADLSPSVRERADLKLRNLPLPAYPFVTALYSNEKEALDPEARSRIESSIEMFKALAALDKRVSEYWRWIRENSLTAYDEVSDRNPKWNDLAREALSLATSWPRSAAQSERMRVVFAQAGEAGCTDPLFIYYHALLYRSEPDADEHKTVEMLREAAAGATRRYPYPAWIKCLVASRAEAATVGRPDLEAPASDVIPPITSRPSFIFEKQIKPQDNVPEPLLYEMADMMSREHGNTGSKYWYEQLSKPFERYAPGSAYLHVLKGTCYGRHALTTRGEETKETPVEWAAEERERRLAIAQEELEKAYEMEPGLVIVQTEMLRILFLRGAEREEIDKWFKRAMAINPDNYQVCTMMVEDLPTERKLEFARKCLESHNWRGRLPFMLVRAHELLANAADDKNEYWKRPEVWKDLKQVYEVQFELFPQAVFDRSYYAMLANRSQQWAEADRQFKILGGRPAVRVFGSMASYDYQRKKAAKNAAATP
jgi:tetratricopeptide (TPR) repeat protein